MAEKRPRGMKKDGTEKAKPGRKRKVTTTNSETPANHSMDVVEIHPISKEDLVEVIPDTPPETASGAMNTTAGTYKLDTEGDVVKVLTENFEDPDFDMAEPIEEEEPEPQKVEYSHPSKLRCTSKAYDRSRPSFNVHPCGSLMERWQYSKDYRFKTWRCPKCGARKVTTGVEV